MIPFPTFATVLLLKNQLLPLVWTAGSEEGGQVTREKVGYAASVASPKLEGGKSLSNNPELGIITTEKTLWVDIKTNLWGRVAQAPTMFKPQVSHQLGPLISELGP